MTHYHVWSCTPAGHEYANSVYDDKYEAAIDYINVVSRMFYKTPVMDHVDISIVLRTMETDGAVVVLSTSMNMVLSSCSQPCSSPIWN